MNEHNHDIDESDVIVADMINEMHSKFRKNLTVKPSIVRKQTMQKFRAKYLDSETWRKVVDALPDNPSIDRGIARIRERVWGQIPKSREDLDYRKVLDTVEGGKVVEVMDSDELWQNKVFRQDLVKAGVLKEDFEEPDD